MVVTIEWPAMVNAQMLDYKPSPKKYPIVEDQTDIGTSQRRLRSTFAIVRHAFKLKLTALELVAFDDFVSSQTVGGTLPFLFPFPSLLGGKKAVRFVLNEGEAYSFKYWDKSKAYVGVELEEYAG